MNLHEDSKCRSSTLLDFKRNIIKMILIPIFSNMIKWLHRPAIYYTQYHIPAKVFGSLHYCSRIRNGTMDQCHVPERRATRDIIDFLFLSQIQEVKYLYLRKKDFLNLQPKAPNPRSLTLLHNHLVKLQSCI